MKKFLLVFIFLTSTIFAQTPLSLEEVKEFFLKHSHLFNGFREGAVYRKIDKHQIVKEDGVVCEYEGVLESTVLLVPEMDGDDLWEVYLLLDYVEKPISDNCDGLLKLENAKMVEIFPIPAFSLRDFRDMELGEEKFFITEDGLLLIEDGKERCFYDYNLPGPFNRIRCENETGITDTSTQMPDSDLNKTYEEIKNFKVQGYYFSGPREISSMELPLKFGEILEHWKNQPKE